MLKGQYEYQPLIGQGHINRLWLKNGNGMSMLDIGTPAQLEAAALKVGVSLETLLPPDFSGAEALDSPFKILSAGGSFDYIE